MDPCKSTAEPLNHGEGASGNILNKGQKLMDRQRRKKQTNKQPRNNYNNQQKRKETGEGTLRLEEVLHKRKDTPCTAVYG